ncbi:MAG: MBL fold metallo-hydrolase [Candidatus Riflebacteria bacterium]|nr:MBL fold metallo-hydrolase [Candidatus Riflebacteria bacterium]
MSRPVAAAGQAPTVERFVLGPLEVNTYLVYDEAGREGLLIDPADEDAGLLARIRKLGFPGWRIFLTHGHADHILGVTYFRQKLGAPVIIGREDAPMLEDSHLNLSDMLGMGFSTGPAETVVGHGDRLTVGRFAGEIIGVPGHTPGGLALHFPGVVFSGDTLFAGGIGRSDFPGGDGVQLVAMIRDRLLPLGEAEVFPGHGPASTLRREGESNPFLQGFSIL